MKVNLLFKNSVYSVLSDGIGIGFKLIAVALLARKIGATDIGAFNLILSITTICTLIFKLGTHRSIVYYKVKSRVLKHEIQVSYQLLTVLLALCASIITALLTPYFSVLFDLQIYKLEFVLAICVFAHIVFLATQQTILSSGNF